MRNYAFLVFAISLLVSSIVLAQDQKKAIVVNIDTGLDGPVGPFSTTNWGKAKVGSGTHVSGIETSPGEVKVDIVPVKYYGEMTVPRIDQIGYSKCEVNKNWSFFPDDFGNSVCLLNYKYPSESHKDISLVLSLETSPGKSQSVQINKCTMLSANHGSHSYLCENKRKGYIIAHYQRGYYTDNRIAIIEVSKDIFKQIKDHESFRLSLEKGNGEMELKNGNYSNSELILNIFK
jgi:hypothetical protein